MRIVLTIISFLTLISIAHAEQIPPEGWRFPTEADYKGDWQENRKQVPVPFHIHADFNGDGLDDDAWILLRSKGVGWGFFVFLSQESGKPAIIELAEDKNDVDYDRFGIALVKPGKYETCLGKDYDLEYPPDEPRELVLTKPAIDFYYYGSSESFFWWNNKTHSFRSTCISD